MTKPIKDGLCPFVLGDKMCGVPRDHLRFWSGCDKTYMSCRMKFANQDRFGGRPEGIE